MERALEILKNNQIISLTREISLIAPSQLRRPKVGVTILKGFRIEKLSDICFVLMPDEKNVIWAEAYDVYNAVIKIYPEEGFKMYEYSGYVDDGLYWYSEGIFLEIDTLNDYICIEINVRYQEYDPPTIETYILKNDEIITVPLEIEDVIKLNEL